MPIDIHTWLGQAQERLQAAFGPRLRFLGLQGSYGRGEAHGGSDIDLVVILDWVEEADWTAYREVLSALPHPELACGFFSGAAELAGWDRADLFQFVHDTTPILGDLSALVPPITREDAARALHRAACDLYHITGHDLLHGRSVEVLAGQFKAAAFALRAKYFLETGRFLRETAALAAALPPEELAVLRGGQGLTADNFEARAHLLLGWAGRILRGPRHEDRRPGLQRCGQVHPGPCSGLGAGRPLPLLGPGQFSSQLGGPGPGGRPADGTAVPGTT